MTNLKMMSRFTLCGVLIWALIWLPEAIAFTGPEAKSHPASFRVLDPIESGKVTLYPIVRAHADEKAAHWRYLTLDQGLKSGEVVITEAGKARGLVRSRNGHSSIIDGPSYSGDQVNTLVLINNSGRPLVLLAGEIVTGGKQDRVIAKDRIVPPHSEPLDLGVFCIEPGRWVERTSKFDAAGKGAHSSFMVEPSVRRKAMAAKSQAQVWEAVGTSIGSGANAPSAPSRRGPMYPGDVDVAENRPAATSSYAQAMSAPRAKAEVDAVAAPVLGENNQVIEKLRHEQVIGVVAAIDGHIVWADLFASPEILSDYWTKLVRSYAAESIHRDTQEGPKAGKEEALHFLSDVSTDGEETSEGKTDVYRYREIQGAKQSLFILEALLPGTGFEVHRTKLVQSSDSNRDAEGHHYHYYR